MRGYIRKKFDYKFIKLACVCACVMCVCVCMCMCNCGVCVYIYKKNLLRNPTRTNMDPKELSKKPSLTSTTLRKIKKSRTLKIKK